MINSRDDVLYLQHVQKLLLAIFDQLEEEIVIVDTNGMVLYLNKALVKLLGGQRDDYIGRSSEDLFPRAVVGPDKANFFRKVAESGQKVEERYSMVTADGQIRYYYISGFPFLDDEGLTHRVVVSRRDITKYMQALEELQLSRRLAVLGEMATYIAHEIRNPLFAIGGFAGRLLKSQSLDEEDRSKVDIIKEESQRLDRILKTIISYIRPVEEDKGDVDVNQLARQAARLIEMEAEGKNISIELQLGNHLPKVQGNADTLLQCVINLMRNAWQAMPSGGQIKIDTRFADAFVYIEVADSGAGIPAEMHDRVFMPFFTTKKDAAGLGLPMTRKIVSELGGSLRLYSQPGQGSLFSMALRPVYAPGAGQLQS